MFLKELSSWLDTQVPPALQEEYDNSGLQLGTPDEVISAALLTTDITDEVIDEASKHGCNLIISHHPLIFRGLKKITGSSTTERMVRRCILEGIAVYSAHTNLDIVYNGVSFKMAEKLGLEKIKVLSPIEGKLLKLVTFVPESHIDSVRDAVFEAGAGVIGNYDRCGYTVAGKGSFRGNEESNPYVGEKGKTHLENEIRFETILFSYLRDKVVNALLLSHPYEEVAFDLYPLENNNVNAGLGCSGILNQAISEKDFLELVSEVFDAKGLRFSPGRGKQILKVAVCGGAGSGLLGAAISSGADAFITADVKYHTFHDAAGRILLIDAGHYETEKFSSEIIRDLILKKFPNFALRFSETNTNPINYL